MAPSRGGVPGQYLTPYNVAVSYGNPGARIVQGNGADWFGPFNPIAPTAPQEVKGREWDFPSGFNLATQPRTYEPVTFHTLRALADGYDVLRLVIETRKDQVGRMSWSIKSRDAKAKDKGDSRIAAITAQLKRPDGERGWNDWIRSVLEDLFVIDAPSVYLDRTNGGKLYALRQIDGATIKPVIDDWGRTPQPLVIGGKTIYPTAYQQVLKGIPAVDYTAKDLLYRPRNKRVNHAYGYGPVEQVMTTVNIALRRQLFTLSYFTEGNVPDSIIQVPETWTPDQILTFQKHWDGYFTGDMATRRRAKFVPGGVGKGMFETKQPELTGEFDNFLHRIICFAFSVSPQALTKMMNRASADTQKEIAEEEGLQPILQWIKEFVDDLIAQEFEAADLEFAWDTDDSVDRTTQATILTGYVSKGIMVINEARDELGLDPLPDPEASQAMIITATGMVPLNSFAQNQQQAASQMQANAEAKAKMEAARPQHAGDNTPPEDDSAEKLAKQSGGAAESDPFSREIISTAETAIAGMLTKALARVAAKAGDMLKSEFGKLAKADPPPDESDQTDRGDRIADDISIHIDLSDLQDAAPAIGDELATVAADTVTGGFAQLGVEDRVDLVNQVNDRAVDAARDRAAELVGMTKNADGEYVVSSNTEMAITDTTREALRTTIADGLADNIGVQALIEVISDSFAFSPKRAATIARTEVSRVNGMASLMSYVAIQATGVTVKKSWLVAPTGCCDICGANAAQGPIKLETAFESGDQFPPAHVNCRCALSPVVGDADQ